MSLSAGTFSRKQLASMGPRSIAELPAGSRGATCVQLPWGHDRSIAERSTASDTATSVMESVGITLKSSALRPR
jgi:hypothetical protein